MSAWTPELDATILQMRRDGVTFSVIAVCVKRTRAAVLGRHYRLVTPPSAMKPREGVRRRRKGNPSSRPYKCYGALEASKTPFASDDSCPDFAWDDHHCAAVLAIGGFPVMPRRAA